LITNDRNDLMAFLVAVGKEILGNNMYKTSTYLRKNCMEQGPLESESFIASRFTGIARVYHCIGLLAGVRYEYLSQLFIHRV
jgi:hypothetical protein